MELLLSEWALTTVTCVMRSDITEPGTQSDKDKSARLHLYLPQRRYIQGIRIRSWGNLVSRERWLRYLSGRDFNASHNFRFSLFLPIRSLKETCLNPDHPGLISAFSTFLDYRANEILCSMIIDNYLDLKRQSFQLIIMSRHRFQFLANPSKKDGTIP